ncbi:molybdopterin-guanine dinucleotide biosynthesis protein B [Paenibacillus sp. ACRRY]|uniref:molybdopterin-guanine dinucleotide biosynthesis protein B n=1 Tax=Paenibacillus sp. ACRRY TaxID=2918208 RepID=UPI001EF628C2|nr:molybdopterin-guanine dinucleotide biosynthesis protein B [Paenibacillus sp. ACRRY]MCG7381162.1 molybdopterin-guanine dinucleotide biosynthesis protein B [Paenibacillus sp. ACRRY]
MANRSTLPPIVQIVGYKNTGKSTLTAELTRFLSSEGLRVAVIKHDGHDHFQMDHEGTDSYRFNQAGASAVVVMSEKRTAIIEQQPTSLETMLTRLSDYDWILIEGYKAAAYPKLVMIREENHVAILQELRGVMAVVSWFPRESLPSAGSEPDPLSDVVWHSVQEPEVIARWLLEHVNKEQS